MPQVYDYDILLIIKNYQSFVKLKFQNQKINVDVNSNFKVFFIQKTCANFICFSPELPALFFMNIRIYRHLGKLRNWK